MMGICVTVFGSAIYKGQDRIGVYVTISFWAQMVNIFYIIGVGYILLKATKKNNYDLKIQVAQILLNTTGLVFFCIGLWTHNILF